MLADAQGNPLSGATAEALPDYAAAVTAFNLYRGDPIGAADRAVAAAPDFAMAHLVKAHLYALATEPGATERARAILGAVRDMPLGTRERAHLAALDHLVAGDWTRAAEALERHSVEHPRDIVALQAGHLTDFYRASPRGLRDRIARALPAWPADLPGRSVLLGMLAFGLEESGDYARAEDAGRAAIDAEPRDAWAHHAVAHVMDMQGRAEDGLGWMAAREPWWTGDDAFFQVHNWWHRALYHLELGDAAGALALYDGPVRGRGGRLALNLVDASALLWRIALAGVDVGGRWTELAAAWDAHADGRHFPFNDWHAAMAYLGAGRDAEVDRLRAAMARGGSEGEGPEAARWARAIGLPLIEGFAAFHRGDHALAAERLFGARTIVNAFGGSHAQRDVIDLTLAEAALRGRLARLAEALANERLGLKPHSPLNRGFLARARGLGGDGDVARAPYS
jgi:tetratricopeptide (TPR) repeat protein